MPACWAAPWMSQLSVSRFWISSWCGLLIARSLPWAEGWAGVSATPAETERARGPGAQTDVPEDRASVPAAAEWRVARVVRFAACECDGKEGVLLVLDMLQLRSAFANY